MFSVNGVGVGAPVPAPADVRTEIGGSLMTTTTTEQLHTVIDSEQSVGIGVIPQPRTPALEKGTAEELLCELGRLEAAAPRAVEIRERLVALYRPLAVKIARRYSGRGEPFDDLNQTAMVGLLKAIDGYNPAYGKPFISYLLPTLTGEIKRHFRDHTWAVRVPRRHQENRSRLNRVVGELQHELRRSPTIGEISRAMELSEEEVLELVQASQAYSALSLDYPDASDEGTEDTLSLEDHLGTEDEALEHVVQRESLKPALARLKPRERTILMLRFFNDRTQTQIARHMGCSQMHVSRLLSRTLNKLRSEMGEEALSHA